MRAVQTCVQVKSYIFIVGGQGSHDFRISGVLHLTLARDKEVIQCFLLEHGLYTIEKNYIKDTNFNYMIESNFTTKNCNASFSNVQ